jgi:hypothetical protein
MSKSQLGIVSPCSTCSNKRYISDPNSRMNVCPRLVAIARYQQETSGSVDDQATASGYEQLVLTGTDDSPSLTASLKNPVYDSEGKSILVWVALLKDNPATIDQSTGQVLNPPITDPGFDTNYITCKALPFTPHSDEHGYFLKGALKEGEPVVTHEGQGQYTLDGLQVLHVAGTVDRASNLGSIARNPILDNNAPEGT